VKVTVDKYAWIRKEDLTALKLQALKKQCLVTPRKVGDFPGDPPNPIQLWRETPTHIGIPREYFLGHRKPSHDITIATTQGAPWPSPLEFNGEMRPEQLRGLRTLLERFSDPLNMGGLVRAKPGWGKTVFCLGLVATLEVPTLVVVHKKFLMDQWRERIEMFLPGAKVGHVQEDTCDYQGCHVVMAMVHSLAGRAYDPGMYEHFGLVITDECHRIGAETWSPVPAKFRARWRIGVSATPRRKDGADAVFKMHIGPLLFSSSEQRLKVKVKRVWSKFRMVKTPKFNPSLAPRSLILKFLCSSKQRNLRIANQVVNAVKAGRKVLVLSERLKHLEAIDACTRDLWRSENPHLFVESNGAAKLTIGYYVGGRTKEELAEDADADVIFATKQYAAEGLDIPALDTLVLATPMGDVEQATGRIQRPFEKESLRWGVVDEKVVRVAVKGKKDPIVVDIRDDNIRMFKKSGEYRDRFFNSVT
jgi:superfamily II DNA or RNA helicase